MARTNGPIKVWNRNDTVPTDAEGGFAGGDSTAAAVGTSLDQSSKALGTVDNLAVTASTLDYGQEASATISGTSPWKTIHVGIPKGMPDDVGQQLVTDAQTAAQQSTASAADAADAVLLAQQAQAASLEIPDDNTAAMIGNPATLTSAALQAIRERVEVNVLDYGATGDGVTDDTAAIQAAIDVIQAAGAGTLKVPAGVYVVTSVDIQSGITIEGAGATFFRPAMTPNWVRMVTNQNRYGARSKSIVIRGLTLDGNLANQGPYDGFELEQSPLIFLSESNSDPDPRKLRVVLDHVTTVNSPSDGIHLHRNIDAVVTNCVGVDCFRGGLTLTGGNSVVYVSNYEGGGDVCGAHVDVEVDAPGLNSSRRLDLTIKGAKFTHRAPVGMGLQLAAYGGGRLTLDDVDATCGLFLAGGDATYGAGAVRVRNCRFETFQSTNRNAIRNPHDVEFTNVEFVSNTSGTAGEVHALNVQHHYGAAPTTDNRLRFKGCTWSVGAHTVGDVPIAVYTAATVAGNTLHVIGGSVSSDFARGFQLASGGSLRMDGEVYVDSAEGARLAASISNGRAYSLTVGACLFGPNVTSSFYLGSGAPENTVRHNGTLVEGAAAQITGANTSLNTYQGSRRLIVPSDPSSGAGLLGDVAQLATPVAGSTYEWVCTSTGVAGWATWKAKSTLAS